MPKDSSPHDLRDILKRTLAVFAENDRMAREEAAARERIESENRITVSAEDLSRQKRQVIAMFQSASRDALPPARGGD